MEPDCSNQEKQCLTLSIVNMCTWRSLVPVGLPQPTHVNDTTETTKQQINLYGNKYSWLVSKGTLLCLFNFIQNSQAQNSQTVILWQINTVTHSLKLLILWSASEIREPEIPHGADPHYNAWASSRHSPLILTKHSGPRGPRWWGIHDAWQLGQTVLMHPDLLQPLLVRPISFLSFARQDSPGVPMESRADLLCRALHAALTMALATWEVPQAGSLTHTMTAWWGRCSYHLLSSLPMLEATPAASRPHHPSPSSHLDTASQKLKSVCLSLSPDKCLTRAKLSANGPPISAVKSVLQVSQSGSPTGSTYWTPKVQHSPGSQLRATPPAPNSLESCRVPPSSTSITVTSCLVPCFN